MNVIMKAVRVHKTGGPEVLTYEDVTDPAPAEGEVIIEQAAIGLNFIDTYFRSGLYPMPSPFILGNEGAGVITAIGEGVGGFRKGDRVAYAGAIGAYAERRAIKATGIVKLPKDISFETAAAMMLKGLTAEYLLHRTCKVKKGDIILVQAAAGGTGQLLTRWGKHLGATVIATVGTADKAKIAKACGADHVINYREADFVAEVKAFTKGALCHVAYDGVGKSTFPAVLDTLRPFGLLASFGSASGPIDGFSMNLLGPKGSLYVTRPTLFTHTSNPQTLKAMAKNLFRAYTEGAIKLAKPTIYKLKDAERAHRALEARETTGSTVFIP
jgi:NADPH:quinone reductase